MEEVYLSDELKTFFTAIQELVDIDPEDLTDEVMAEMQKQINATVTSATIKESVNQIIKNLEMQDTSREDALKAMNAMKTLINELVYGEKFYTGNKKILIEGIVKAIFDIFDEVSNRYHLISIDLPMTIEEGAKVPTYAHETDAAADLYAMEDMILPGNSKGNKIRTGIKIELPESWLALIIPRSSIGVKTPLRLSNSVGLIDSGYRGELGVLYDNTSDKPYDIHAGDRIAQLLIMPSYRFRAKVVNELTDSDRGEGGFGSSGN